MMDYQLHEKCFFFALQILADKPMGFRSEEEIEKYVKESGQLADHLASAMRVYLENKRAECENKTGAE